MSTVQNINNIVTDGLTMYLDAANTRSYPGTGTTWTDLSRSSINGTLVNGPTYSSANGGGIVFDGTDDSITISQSSLWNLGSSDFTIELWFRMYSPTSTFPRLIKTTNDNGIASLSLTVSNLNTFYLYLSSNGSSYDIANALNVGPVSFNNYNYVTLSRVGTSVLTYINSSLSATTAIGTSSLVYNASVPPCIGGTPAGGRTLNGIIPIFRFYKNKGLTATEVLQNYNVTKKRFGL